MAGTGKTEQRGTIEFEVEQEQNNEYDLFMIWKEYLSCILDSISCQLVTRRTLLHHSLRIPHSFAKIVICPDMPTNAQNLPNPEPFPSPNRRSFSYP